MQNNININNSKQIDISILGANFLNLQKLLDLIIKTKIVKRLHYDVMDYDFVNNLSFGPHILKNISEYLNNDIKIDCHMMTKIKNLSVEKYLKPFINCKIDIITFHIEALNDKQIIDFLNIKKKYNQKIGLALKPGTSIKKIFSYVDKIDLILIMSVEPGFGGQTFIENTKNKINDLRKYLNKNNMNVLIQVDGGINDNTIKFCNNSDIIVVGNYLATSKNKKEFYSQIKKLHENSI